MKNSKKAKGLPIRSRRDFIDLSLKSLGLLSISTLEGKPFSITKASKIELTIQDTIHLILKEGQLKPIEGTVDTIKIGDANQKLKGVVTTMFPTIPVINQTIQLGANFLIVHEPSYYNHPDKLNFIPHNDVLNKKMDLLNQNSLVIWRFHDYIHSMKPDFIDQGVIEKAGWTAYSKPDSTVLKIPEQSLADLINHLKKTLSISHLRIIGNLDQKCSKLVLLPGAVGGQTHLKTVQEENPDVLIVGELSEWETGEYIRDRNDLGFKTALIILGHALSEEPGMEYFANWLRPKIEPIKVHHLSSGDPFTWL